MSPDLVVAPTRVNRGMTVDEPTCAPSEPSPMMMSISRSPPSRRVEDLLHCSVETVNLVDEEHVAMLEPGEDRGEVAAARERGTGGDSKARTHLCGDDPRQGGLAEPRRPSEEHVVDRLVATSSGLEDDRQLLFQFALTNELGEQGEDEARLRGPAYALVDFRRDRAVKCRQRRRPRPAAETTSSRGLIAKEPSVLRGLPEQDFGGEPLRRGSLPALPDLVGPVSQGSRVPRERREVSLGFPGRYSGASIPGASRSRRWPELELEALRRPLADAAALQLSPRLEVTRAQRPEQRRWRKRPEDRDRERWSDAVRGQQQLESPGVRCRDPESRTAGCAFPPGRGYGPRSSSADHDASGELCRVPVRDRHEIADAVDVDDELGRMVAVQLEVDDLSS